MTKVVARSIILTATAAMATGTQLFEGAHLTGGNTHSYLVFVIFFTQAKFLENKRGSPLYKLFGAGWGQKGVGGFFLKIRPHSCV